MNRAIIINFETGEKLHEMDVKGFEFRDVAKEIEAAQEKEDILGIGRPCVIVNSGFGLGISSYYKGNGYCSTIKSPAKDFSFKRNSDGSYIIGHGSEKEKEIPSNLKIETEDRAGVDEINLKLGVIIYRQGLVLSVGKTNYNILGIGYDAYMVKFTRTKVISGAKDGAKVFNNPKAVMKYLKEHEREFKYIIANHDFQLSVEYVTPEYEESIKNLSKKKLEKFETDLKEVQEYINTLNESEDEAEKESTPIPEKATEETIKAEILYRMKKLSLMSDVVKHFNEGKLMMSEGAGILYFLNDKAKDAVAKAEDDGLIPYHVVRSYTEFGELYDVLYVSRRTQAWEAERPNKGYVESLCYNSSGGFSEYGDIRVVSCNGGVKRTE